MLMSWFILSFVFSIHDLDGADKCPPLFQCSKFS